MAIYYIDPISGNDSSDGSTLNLSGLPTVGPKKQVSGVTPADGDEVRVVASPPYDTGATFSATEGNTYFTVNDISLIGKIINPCTSSWTAGTGVTSSTNTTDSKNSGACTNISMASGFTTGKAAYQDLGSTIDFSAYNCVNFHLSSSVVLSSEYEIRLCSDTTGDVSVLTLSVTGARNNVQKILLHNNFAALPTNVRSIALYFPTDPGTVVFRISQIWAGIINPGDDGVEANTDGAYIGTNVWSTIGGQNEEYFYIRYLDEGNDRIYLDHPAGTTALGTINVYSAYTNAALYSKQGFPFNNLYTSATFSLGSANTSKNTKKLVGGYRYDGANIVKTTGHKSVDVHNVTGVAAGANGWTIEDTQHYSTYFQNSQTYKNCILWPALSAATSSYNVFKNCKLFTSGTTLTNSDFINCDFYRAGSTAANLISVGVTRFKNCYFKKGENTQSAIAHSSNRLIGRWHYSASFIDCTFEESLVVQNAIETSTLFSQDHNGTAGNHKLYTGSSVVAQWQTTEKQGSDPGSWELIPIGSIQHSSYNLKLAEIAVTSGTPVTINAWVKKNHATTIDASVGLYEVFSPAYDTETFVYASDNTNWQELEITFTPDRTGIVTLLGRCELRNSSSVVSVFFGSITVNQ